MNRWLNTFVTLQTTGLTLVAANADLVRAELLGQRAFSDALAVSVPPNWPPALYERPFVEWTLAQLNGDPKLSGWLTWYWILNAEPEPVLIGAGGFKGKPNHSGSVEIGYNVLEQHQRQGFATEAVGELVKWAFSHPEVTEVFAETLPELARSIRVLKKCGFEFAGNGSDIEVLRFGRKRGSR